jgi:hypothetical protein
VIAFMEEPLSCLGGENVCFCNFLSLAAVDMEDMDMEGVSLSRRKCQQKRQKKRLGGGYRPRGAGGGSRRRWATDRSIYRC